MAGQPKRRAMREELERLTREYFEGDPVPTVVQYAACRLEDGSTLADIAKEITATLGFDVPRQWVSEYVHDQEGAADVVRTARARASHSWAEKAIGAVEAQVKDSVGVAQMNHKARTYMRMAEAMDAGTYAQQKGLSVSNSVIHLHLDALRHAGSRVTGSLESTPSNAQLPASQPIQVIAAPSVNEG
jgi:hypothetical protein